MRNGGPLYWDLAPRSQKGGEIVIQTLQGYGSGHIIIFFNIILY